MAWMCSSVYISLTDTYEVVCILGARTVYPRVLTTPVRMAPLVERSVYTPTSVIVRRALLGLCVKLTLVSGSLSLRT